METGLNLVILMGRATMQPEIKDTTSGRIMCKTRLAVNRPYLGKNAPQQTDYFDVVSFGELGQNIYNNLGKGARATIVGRVEQSEYVSRSGDKREKYSIVANRIIIHDWKNSRRSKENQELFDELDVPREIWESLQKADARDNMYAVSADDPDMPE